MSRCSSCKGAFPEGCSACRTYTVGRITFDPPRLVHTCSDCMRGLPCGGYKDTLTADMAWKTSQPSLSAAIGAVIERTKAEPDRRSRECQ